MAYVKLYGGIDCSGIGLEATDYLDIEAIERLKDKGVTGDYEWTAHTKMLANMDGSLSGGNEDVPAVGIDHYIIYKTIGDKDKLYKIYETDGLEQKIVEDFIVGDMCSYTYYVYPVIKDGDKLKMGVPLISDDVYLRTNEVVVSGLIPVGHNTYTIDDNNVWAFQLNMVDGGQEQKLSKTFYPTQNAYSKVSGANVATITKTITGLLGKLDCTNAKYIDTYDYINDWLAFTRSNCLKVLIDSRGFIIPCDIVSSSISYMDVEERCASVQFSIEQIACIDNITILARSLTLNPTNSEYLMSLDDKFLQDNDELYLAVEKE